MIWDEFISRLENEIDWDNTTLEECQKLEVILKEFSRFPEQLELRCNEIIHNDELFEAYKRHMEYPRITMDKFILHMDKDDRFRVRLHRIKAKKLNGDTVAKVHSHKWVYSTIILKGSYLENTWDVISTDDLTEEAELKYTGSKVLKVGDTNSGLVNVAHQTLNESDDEHCISLFVRGRSLEDAAKIYNLENNTFYYTYSPDEFVKMGLGYIGKLNAEFHG
ncbi:hypothetical protein ACK8P5_03780 [Paenibacillus sp. EC2-1]|uniref:hypothetical protein n=1 Tax=Paenibacillus sp. EC2-1 TaxID=3388665 RepID=UPI003BEEF46B